MNKYSYLVTVMFCIYGCVEEFEVDSDISGFQSILVVDARLTDRVETQSINLSRTFEFDSVPKPERNAQVSLVGSNGATFLFNEGDSGIYRSTSDLQLLSGESYQLQIVTQDGRSFSSDFEQLPEPVQIGDMQAIRRTNNSGIEGVAVVMDNAPNSSQPEFFRYEYEETFKIIAPDFNPFEWDEVDYDHFCEDDDGWQATITAREEEAQTCFGSNNSIDMILASTADLGTSGLEDFEIRFLGRENYFISHRYSILVKQYHHSSDANSFFSTLQDFSDFSGVFSNVQTGLLESNVSATNSDEPVLGYFELSSYTEKRMFFNYSDLFPNEELPPYIISCDLVTMPPLYPEEFHITLIGSTDGKPIIDAGDNSPLLDGILAGLIGFVGLNGDFVEVGGVGVPGSAPYFVKNPGCVDCREFGSNIIPDFWIEE